MTTQDVLQALQKNFPDANFELHEIQPESAIRIPGERIADIAAYLKETPELSFDALMCLSAVDRQGSFEVVYHIHSMKHNHRTVLKVSLPGENPQVPTVSHIWRTAEWHEREAYDLVGVEFLNHPDPRRILLPDDWVGHPLKKDYQAPEEYNGLKVAYDNLKDSPSLDWE